MDVVLQIISLIVVALFAWFYYYLDKLEKIGCECALNRTRTLLMVSVATIIIFRLIDIMTPLPTLAQIVLSFSSFMFIIVAITYVNYLKKEKCKCSETTARKVIEIYVWIVVIIWIIAILFLVLLLILHTSNRRYLQQGVSNAS